MIRYMMKEDYKAVRELWEKTEGFHIRKLDDSQTNIEKLLERNPRMSIVAENNGEIVGSVLCGHDGRSGMLYHICVDKLYRRQGIGTAMVEKAVCALKREGICTVLLIAFSDNKAGNQFWNKIGWRKTEAINFYDYTLNLSNTIKIVAEVQENI